MDAIVLSKIPKGGTDSGIMQAGISGSDKGDLLMSLI